MFEPPHPRNHNQGPPLDDEHVPEWGRGGFGTYFEWRSAHRKAWKPASRDIVLHRLARAEAAGLTYEEYMLELLDTGRFLQRGDRRAAAIIGLRRRSIPG
jgi:hypothetical protein